MWGSGSITTARASCCAATRRWWRIRAKSWSSADTGCRAAASRDTWPWRTTGKRMSDDDTPEAILARAADRARRMSLPYAGAVTPAEAHRLAETGAAKIVDVRTPPEWEQVGHVKGAPLIEWPLSGEPGAVGPFVSRWGRALLAPEGLHARVHDGAWLHREIEARIRQAQREGARDQRRRARLAPRVGGRHRGDVGLQGRVSDPRRSRPQGGQPLRHDPSERQRHVDGALGLRDRPEEEDPPHHHVPGEHRAQLRRDPARDRFDAVDRQPQCRDPGQLEAGRGRGHLALDPGSRGAQEEIPEGVQDAQALPAHDPAARPLRAAAGREHARVFPGLRGKNPRQWGPMIPWLRGEQPFPPVSKALKSPNGLLCAGGDLAPHRVVEAYRHGIFPWYSEGDPILWWSPDPRMVLFPAELKVSRSLRRTLARRTFETRFDTAFRSVIEACSAPRAGHSGTWIVPEMVEAYVALHELGFAHSVESWQDGVLVGGLYGIGLGRAFFGESMFSRADEADAVEPAHQ